MSHPITFELCAESLEACLAAKAGGADRIELCRDLSVGGLTPDTATLRRAVAGTDLPIHVLLRPTADTFEGTPTIVTAIRHSLRDASRCGAAGVVLGLLRADGRVDVEQTRALVAMAAPLPVTFHRAFDAAANLEEALEAVIASGCVRVLTSGGAPDVLRGAARIARLREQAGNRIEVMAGGGLTLNNALEVARTTGLKQFHASLRPKDRRTTPSSSPGDEQEGFRRRIASMVRVLSQADEMGADARPFAPAS